MRLGPFELILILCIALIIFGPSKLPQLAKSMGEAVREFRKGQEQLSKGIETLAEEPVHTPAPAAAPAKAAEHAAPQGDDVK